MKIMRKGFAPPKKTPDSARRRTDGGSDGSAGNGAACGLCLE